MPAISDDSTRLVFNCGPQPYVVSGAAICQVNTDASSFEVVLTPADSPAGQPTTGAFRQPDYGPDGDIIFEADWNGENIWSLPVGAKEPILISHSLNNDNSPCVLPDGRIVSLWLGNPDGDGSHQLKIMDPEDGRTSQTYR